MKVFNFDVVPFIHFFQLILNIKIHLILIFLGKYFFYPQELYLSSLPPVFRYLILVVSPLSSVETDRKFASN